MRLHMHLNAEHGEAEGDESPEAEENVSVCNKWMFCKLEL